MTKLWQELTDELGSAFRNQYGLAGEATFLKWAKELSGFTEAQLFKGFNNFKNSGSTYMSLNILRNHCQVKAEDLGLNSFESSYSLIQQRNWEELHPAFMHVANKTKEVEIVVSHGGGAPDKKKIHHRLVFDLSVLAHGTEFESRRVAKEIYDEVAKRIGAGEQFERTKLLTGRTKREYVVPDLNLDMNGPRGQDAMSSVLRMMGSAKAYG